MDDHNHNPASDWPPSKNFDPWYLPDPTLEQWLSWPQSKRWLVFNVVADIWHFECKKGREDYLRDGVLSKLALATDLYLQALER